MFGKNAKKQGIKKQRIIEETLPEDAVHLKPLFGVRPGVYLAGLYGVILGGILFFVLVYPGLTKPGTVVRFTSEPSGAAVRVDDVYRGTAPCEVFIPKGTRLVEFVLPGFEPYRQETAVEGRVFGSRLVPRRDALHGTLMETAPGAALVWAAADYGAWAFTGEPTATRQIPPILSEGAYWSGPGGAHAEGYSYLKGILKGAARFTATRAGLRDLVRAEYIVDNAGLAASPVSMLHTIEDMLVYLSEAPGAAQWLEPLASPETAAVLTDSAWYRKSQAPASAPAGMPTANPPVISKPIIKGVTFWDISGGTLFREQGFMKELADFKMAETKVTADAWAEFVKANPAWDREQTKILAAQGLVTEDYLSSGIYSDEAVTGVSWYGAKAYCAWLTTQLPEDLADYAVRLPTETEWEYAAKTGGLSDMFGSLWEWCENPYALNDDLPADQRSIAVIGSPERAVRGGPVSQENGIETRGSLTPALCSSFGSFRLVIAKK